MSLDRRSDGLTAASCHTRKELEHAMRLELDFAVLGPVKDKSPVLGWDRFRDLVAFSSIPVYAIGGQTRARRGYDSGGLDLVRSSRVSSATR
jgi:8-oxo-dGTP diphosphatase